MAAKSEGVSPTKQLEHVKQAAARANIRERMQEQVDRAKSALKAEKAKAKDGTGRVVQAVEVLVGAAAAGAIEGAWPEAKWGPLDARKGVTLAAGAAGLFLKGAYGNHAFNLAEGMAASIVSDMAKDAGASWRSKRAQAPASDGKASNATEGNDGDAVSKLRRVVLSSPGRDERRERADRPRRRAGGGLP